jgi:amino acid adenylation domain-containing protein
MLIEKGVLADNIVAIMMERSIETIIAIFGILKAGGAYLPIDPLYPQERVDYMLKDSNAKILINKSEIRNSKFETNPNDQTINDQNESLQCGTAIVLNFEHLNFDIVSCFEFRASNFNSSNLAYIIYTSGSTGKPKGVMVEHRSIVNYIWWAIKSYMDENAGNICFPLFTPLPFDLTVTSIFSPLLSGNMIIIYKETLIDQIIEENRVEIVKLTPSHLKMIVEMEGKINSTIKKFIVGGESLETDLAGRVAQKFNKTPEIFNEYGPTEATVGCMIYKFSPGTDTDNLRSVPIGIPADNVQIYLLDKNQKPVPIGLAGEIYISGAGLARGYLNRPELTAEKFVAHELHELNELKQIKNKSRENFHHSNLYRTGDLARWLNDGNIEFLGRIDNQIKIRGFRVELGEIELQLLSHDGIKTSVVLLMAENGENYLCAYFTADKEVEIAGLRDGLAKKLPHYMIPSYFNQIESMPLTTTGKLDRKTLASIGHKSNIEIEFVAPQNDTEKIVAAVWKEVLGIEQVGIYDNFFNIGGNSLRLITLNTKLNTVLGTNIPAAKLFEHVTISAFVRYYAGKETGGSPPGAIIDKSNTISDVKKSRERRKERRRANSND